ncbi:MAG: ABC transporter ATP-binding protein [Parcubacteria group bacterium]|jgi:ABC-type multidrug transport system fused ATPase/permease subunit
MIQENLKTTAKRQFDIKGFWIRLWKLLSPSHKQIRNLIFFIMAEELIRLAGPYILKLIIDLITNFKSENIPQIAIFIAAMLLANQIYSLSSYITDRKIFLLLTTVEKYLSNNAHSKMVFLSLGYHEKENTGNKIMKIQRGVDRINDLLSNFSWEVAPTIFQIIFTTIALFFIDWRFGVVILVFVPIFILLTFRVNKKAFPFRSERYDEQEKSSGLMTQSIININTVKSFSQENNERSRFEKITKKIKDLIMLEYGLIMKYNLKRNFVIDLGRTFILFLGVYLAWKQSITIGSLIFVITISEKALISLFRISRLYDRIMESGEAVERLYDLSLEKSEIENPKNGLRPTSIEGTIKFENVTYAYADSKIKALENVTMRIQAGCTTALVGPSGGGKTTVARLIYRHYDPEQGQIILDGKNLKEYDLYAFRKFIAIVPQEVEIFNTSVRENIAYAKPRASISEIKAAARIANAEEFINNLNEGYDTLVGERGIKLSGGQRQRLGIARAILANPKILIFDEATSSLDSYSERLIQDAMDKISRGRTVIIIAHRLSTIKKSDKIVVLEKGKVVEEGSHFELARSGGGLYKKLLELQKMGDVE